MNARETLLCNLLWASGNVRTVQEDGVGGWRDVEEKGERGIKHTDHASGPLPVFQVIRVPSPIF